MSWIIITKFHWVLNSIKISLVQRAPDQPLCDRLFQQSTPHSPHASDDACRTCETVYNLVGHAETASRLVSSYCTPRSWCACILTSGGKILLFLVYNSWKWRAVSSNVVFLAWFHENNKMALLDVFPIRWCMYIFPASIHTNTWNTESFFMYLDVHKIWRAWRGIKTESIFLRLCD